MMAPILVILLGICSALALSMGAYVLNVQLLLGGVTIFALSMWGGGFRGKKCLLLSLISYYFLCVVGMLLVLHHLHYYDQPFDAWIDDSNYFSDAFAIATGKDVRAYSIYEYIIAMPLAVFSDLVEIKPLIALWMNWLAGGITIGLIYLFTKEYIGRAPRIHLIAVLVLGNYIFVQNIAHLYRDVFVVLFFMASLYFTLKKKYLIAVLFLVLLAAVRLPSALVACMFMYVLFGGSEGRSTSFAAKAIFATCVLGGLTVLYVTGIEYLPGKSLNVMGEYLAARTEVWGEEVAEDDGGGGLAHRLPFPANVPAVFVFQVLSPIRLLDIYLPDNVFYFDRGEMVSHKSIGYSVTALLWLYSGPLLMAGFFVTLFGNKRQRTFFIVFLVTCLLLGFVSFQERHKMIIIALFPIFSEYGYEYMKNRRLVRYAGYLSFAIFWLLINAAWWF